VEEVVVVPEKVTNEQRKPSSPPALTSNCRPIKLVDPPTHKIDPVLLQWQREEFLVNIMNLPAIDAVFFIGQFNNYVEVNQSNINDRFEYISKEFPNLKVGSSHWCFMRQLFIECRGIDLSTAPVEITSKMPSSVSRFLGDVATSTTPEQPKDVPKTPIAKIDGNPIVNGDGGPPLIIEGIDADAVATRKLNCLDTKWYENLDNWIVDELHLTAYPRPTIVDEDLRPDLCLVNKLLHPDPKLVNVKLECRPIWRIPNPIQKGVVYHVPIPFVSYFRTRTIKSVASLEIAAQVLTSNNVNAMLTPEIIEHKVCAAVSSVSSTNWDRYAIVEGEPAFIQQSTINLCYDLTRKMRYENRHRDFIRGRVTIAALCSDTEPMKWSSRIFQLLKMISKFGVMTLTVYVCYVRIPAFRWVVKFSIALTLMLTLVVVPPYLMASSTDLLVSLPNLVRDFSGGFGGLSVFGYMTIFNLLIVMLIRRLIRG
jgi:hypothetical protein